MNESIQITGAREQIEAIRKIAAALGLSAIAGVDVTNAWPQNTPEENIEGVYETKEAISYPIRFEDNLYALGWYMPKSGALIKPHTHEYRHYSYLVRGSVVVVGEAERPDGTIIVAPDFMRFEAGSKHSIRALVDDTHLVHLYPAGLLDLSEG